ncbi:hypothetical protein [Curtobacterium sp. MCBD17_008]|uniref:hypothetical protein n=1 Tax=Curtobacterium sp. MCBD17_008 TaxID=2175656 RepID=UPI0011B73972|nr:hypothetical protein [Curtobacterium sp. MCBD17_008]
MTRRWRELRRRLLAEERGISLVELIVAMTLSILILTVAGSFLVSAQRASVTARAVNDNTRTAAAAMNEMTRILRSATNNAVSTGDEPQYAFQYASATSVRFFSYVNTDSTASRPVLVQLTLDPVRRSITETKWAGTQVGASDYYTFPLASTPSLSATPVLTRTLATSVVSTRAFTFTNAAGAPLGSIDAPLSATDLTNVRRVAITITAGTDVSDRRATTLTNSVSLANL